MFNNLFFDFVIYSVQQQFFNVEIVQYFTMSGIPTHVFYNNTSILISDIPHSISDCRICKFPSVCMIVLPSTKQLVIPYSTYIDLYYNVIIELCVGAYLHTFLHINIPMRSTYHITCISGSP